MDSTILRFLQYSLEREKPIRLMWQQDAAIRQANVQVTSVAGDTVTFLTLRPKGQVTCDAGMILSADYKKGDDGQ
ncbi:MAG: hypothetical protein Q4C54_08225 [Clostridia bacterium]|nr:hypothetical protein [Clostridia bacterium]